MSKNSLLIIIFLSFLLFGYAQNDESLLNEYNKKLNYKKEVYYKTLEYIKENPDSYGLANLYFNIAEMSIEIESNRPDITAEYYRKVLELNPDFPNKDVVLYNIGYYGFNAVVYKRDDVRQANIDMAINWPDSLRLSTAKLQNSINAYKEIVAEYPNSKYYSEALYRLGTIYFEIATDTRKDKTEFYDKAIEYFDLIAQKDGDPFQYYGLFQRAWTYFTSAQFEKAISDFTSILAIIHQDSTKSEKLFFEDDAIDNIAFSLIEYDAGDYKQASIAADKAREIFENYVSDIYSEEIILKAIDLKLEYNAPMQAIDLYKAYIDIYPTNIICPSYIDSIMTIYKRYPSRTREEDAKKLILSQMEYLVQNYTINSEWYQINKDKDIYDQLSVIKDAYEFIEPKYFNRFLESQSEEDFDNYKELVDNYFAYPEFQDSESIANKKAIRRRIVDISLNLAETTESPTHYFSAINRMNNFNIENPDHTDFYNFEDEIFYCYERIYAILQPEINENVFQDSISNIHLDQSGLDSLFIDATTRYENILKDSGYPNTPTETKLIEIIYKRAEIRYNNEQYEDAFYDYEELLSYETEAEIKKLAYARLAELSQNNGEYALAENYFRKATEFATKEEKESLENNILASIQSNAKNMMQNQDYLSAADNYLRLADELEESEMNQKIGFILKAIEAYKKAGEYQKAIDYLLEIASMKSEINEVKSAYANAWSIADSLEDWYLSESLRNQFIEKFPDSNEAFNVRLQIIDFYKGPQFNNKEAAAEMYLELYDDISRIDIGDVSEESIYLNALRIYQDLGNQEKEITLMVRFEKLYPDHPKSNDFLQKVALIYHENGEDQKFDELARYLYKKDPSIDLVTGIAVKKLKMVKAEADSFFTQKEYELMDQKITEFKHIDKSYQEDNLNLPLEGIYEQFQYYYAYIDYYNKFDDKIAVIEVDFLNSSPQSLIKVNTLTKWKDHLAGGKDRIKKLTNRCDEIKKDLIALIQEGNKYKYDLDIEKRTHTFYLIGNVYEFSSSVVETQVKKFVDTSNQLNDETAQQNPEMQQKYKTALTNAGMKYALNFKTQAAKIYQQLLILFYDDKNYSDQWTEKALTTLFEWGVRKEKIYHDLYSDATWLVNQYKIDNILAAVNNDTLWNYVSTLPDTSFFDFAKIIKLDSNMNSFIKTDFQTEHDPESMTIHYISYSPLTILLNGNEIPAESSMLDSVRVNNYILSEYSVKIEENLIAGNYDLVFRAGNNSENNENYIATHIILQYDKENVENSNKIIDNNIEETDMSPEDKEMNEVEE